MLSRAAGELLAHVLYHFPMSGHELQRLGHILADLVQKPAAARTRGRGRINDALARQMLGQRPARRLASLEAAHRNLRLCRGQLRHGLRLRGIFFQLGKPQLELLQERAPFRGLSELLVPQLGNRVFELLDQQGAMFRFALQHARSRLSSNECGARLDNHCMRSSQISRKRISHRSHAGDSNHKMSRL